MPDDPRAFLKSLFAAAVASADPRLCLARHLPEPPKGRTVVVGAGKAAATMVQAVEAVWPRPLSGVVVTRYGHALPTRSVKVLEAAHPVPDENGLIGARRILETVAGLSAEDLVLCLVSGGGSALLPLPLDGLQLADEQAVNTALLACGATIGEINCVRRHLSAIKGGRLALACRPAQLVSLAISDVPGDLPADVASGPTVPDATTCADALSILTRYRIEIPANVRNVLESGRGESVKADDPRLPALDFRVIATPQKALEAAAAKAKAEGIETHILSDRIEGEARDVGKVLAGIALQVAARGQPFRPPCLLLSGGETTVTVRGAGRGGRNVEFLLALALALDGHPQIHALAGDTDGVDGLEEIAGAYCGPETLARAWGKGLRPPDALMKNDGHGFFEALGDSIVTGPTLTNVNDFRAILIT